MIFLRDCVQKVGKCDDLSVFCRTFATDYKEMT